MFHTPRLSISGSACALLLAVLLTACGGGSNDNMLPAGNQDGIQNITTAAALPLIPPRIINARGALLENGEHLRLNSVEEITAAVDDPLAKSPPVIPVYPVKNYRLTYLTIDSKGELAEASGLVAVPQKPAGAYSPLLSFQHGTIFYDREAPTNDPTPTSPANIIASQGYIVLAADYVGYGASKGKAHPYLQAEPSAASVVDFITAARQWLTEQRIPVNEQLFLTGYSEGGYVTLAAQQALEAAGVPITATVAGAGPYDLKYTLDELLDTSDVLGAIGSVIGNWWQSLRPEADSPQLAAKYPGKLDEAKVNALLYFLIPKDSDVEFDKTFLMDWMGDDDEAMRRNSVHDWKALTPIRLTHGQDDETVPFGNSIRALAAMRNQGTSDIELEECIVSPSDHTNCIRPYGTVLINYFSTMVRDL